MATFSLTGDDTIDLNVAPNLTNDLADGDAVILTVPNDLVNMNVGKNGNAIYAKDENGNRFEMELRVLKGTGSDANLLAKYLATRANFSGSTFITGQFVKHFGDGMGNVQAYTYTVGGGMIRKAPEMKSNVNGDTEQSVTVYQVIGTITDINIG